MDSTAFYMPFLHAIFSKTFPANQQNRLVISRYQCHVVKNLQAS